MALEAAIEDAGDAWAKAASDAFRTNHGMLIIRLPLNNPLFHICFGTADMTLHKRADWADGLKMWEMQGQGQPQQQQKEL